MKQTASKAQLLGGLFGYFFHTQDRLPSLFTIFYLPLSRIITTGTGVGLSKSNVEVSSQKSQVSNTSQPHVNSIPTCSLHLHFL